MKNWKKLNVIGIILVFVFGFIGCDKNENNDLCNCDPKEHLAIDENCSCGGDKCNCSAKIYGTVNGINIYREEGVKDVEAIPFAESIISVHSDMTPSGKNNINTNKVSAIHITVDKTDCLSDNSGTQKIIYIAVDQLDNLEDIFWFFNDDYLAQLQQNKKIAFMLLKVFIPLFPPSMA